MRSAALALAAALVAALVVTGAPNALAAGPPAPGPTAAAVQMPDATTVEVAPVVGATTTAAATLSVVVRADGVPTADVTGRIDVSAPTWASAPVPVVAGRAQVVLPPLTATDHVLTVAFTPADPAALAPSSTTTTVSTTRVPATALLVLGQDVVAADERAVVTLSVTAPGTVPDGEVSVRDGGETLIATHLTGGRAVVELPALAPGRHVLTLAWGGNSVARDTLSPPVVLTVAEGGAPVIAARTWTADTAERALVRVTGTQRGLPLSGPLTIREDGRVVTRARLDAGSTWFRMPLLPAGTHHLTIALDGPRGPRTTTAVDLVITPAP